jgi:hypothetical protein
MLALISPQENNRICQVEEEKFSVSEPLYWTTCPDNCTPNWTYIDGQFEPPFPTANDNKATASALLSNTDWTSVADVGNPAMSNPYLANQAEFIAYRNAVRQYAVYPVAGNITFPTAPQEVWTKV